MLLADCLQWAWCWSGTLILHPLAELPSCGVSPSACGASPAALFGEVLLVELRLQLLLLLLLLLLLAAVAVVPMLP